MAKVTLHFFLRSHVAGPTAFKPSSPGPSPGPAPVTPRPHRPRPVPGEGADTSIPPGGKQRRRRDCQVGSSPRADPSPRRGGWGGALEDRKRETEAPRGLLSPGLHPPQSGGSRAGGPQIAPRQPSATHPTRQHPAAERLGAAPRRCLPREKCSSSLRRLGRKPRRTRTRTRVLAPSRPRARPSDWVLSVSIRKSQSDSAGGPAPVTWSVQPITKLPSAAPSPMSLEVGLLPSGAGARHAQRAEWRSMDQSLD